MKIKTKGSVEFETHSFRYLHKQITWTVFDIFRKISRHKWTHHWLRHKNRCSKFDKIFSYHKTGSREGVVVPLKNDIISISSWILTSEGSKGLRKRALNEYLYQIIWVWPPNPLTLHLRRVGFIDNLQNLKRYSNIFKLDSFSTSLFSTCLATIIIS